MNKAFVLSRNLNHDMPRGGPEVTVGIMFGRENSGLTNAEVARADKILTVDANPGGPAVVFCIAEG